MLIDVKSEREHLNKINVYACGGPLFRRLNDEVKYRRKAFAFFTGRTFFRQVLRLHTGPATDSLCIER